MIEVAWDVRNTWTWKKLRIELLYVADLVGTLIVVDNGRTPPLPWVKSRDSIM